MGAQQANQLRIQWSRVTAWSMTVVAPRLASARRAGARLGDALHPQRPAVTSGPSSGHRVHPMFRFVYYFVPPPLLRLRPRPRANQSAEAKPRARIIANPNSGSMRGELSFDDLEKTARWMTERGIPSEVCYTERPGHARELATEAVKAGMDIVVAAGGDGTVNEVVQALAGQNTALGVLPIGTVNVWAREMGIPLRLSQARELIVSGVRRRVDLGRAGSHYFLLMAGIGFDAEVARRVDRGPLARWGLKLLDYAATASYMGVTQRPARIWMRLDGRRRTTDALMVLIGNTRLYGGAFRIAKDAIADDGLLDVVIIGGGGTLARLSLLARALARHRSLGPRVRYERCRTIRLESGVPLPVQVDGDVIGTLPMTFSVSPRALSVIVSPQAPADLFAREPLQPS
jgi:diacylglycerol kinase (ATP)